jgi:hypothetical protein
MRPSLIMIGTFLFGIAPGTLLVVFAVLLGTAPAIGLLYGDFGKALLAALLTIPVAVMAMLRYVALSYAAFDELSPRTARWLLAGIVANLIGIGLLMSESEWWGEAGPGPGLSPGLLFVLSSPLVVGCAHLARYLLWTRRHRASV